jgi:hypothetical protein
MAERIENIGSVVIVIKDTSGNVFGAFASQPVKQQPKFHGDQNNFLFRLRPTIDIHYATIINQHYQYFNYGMQSLPNGIGFGGQLEYFGLWLDSSFGHGHSKAQPRSTTYDSPQLSAKEEFDIDLVECFCIKEIEIDDRLVPDTKKKKSVFDSHATESAILEMAGRNMVGLNLRQAPHADDVTIEERPIHKPVLHQS